MESLGTIVVCLVVIALVGTIQYRENRTIEQKLHHYQEILSGQYLPKETIRLAEQNKALRMFILERGLLSFEELDEQFGPNAPSQQLDELLPLLQEALERFEPKRSLKTFETFEGEEI